MEIFKLPKGVSNNIEKLCRRWLWRGGEGGRHLVKWADICRPFTEGGLGITPLQEMNGALLAKWWWKWRINPKASWAVICSSISKEGQFNNSVWRKEIEGYKSWIEDHSYCKVGKGRKVSFWKDKWLEKGRTIREEFPLLYKIAKRPDMSVMDSREWGEAGWAWKIDFKRELRELEMEELLALLKKLQQVERQKEDKDTWLWQTDKIFTVRDCKNWLQKRRAQIQWSSYYTVWKVQSPPRVKFFMWTMALDKIITKEKRKKWDKSDDGICVLCKAEEENVKHLFFKCKITKEVWDFTNWRIDMRDNQLEDFEKKICLTNYKGRKHHKDQAKVLHAVSWAIWLHRNDIIFKGATTSINSIQHNVFNFLNSWKFT